MTSAAFRGRGALVLQESAMRKRRVWVLSCFLACIGSSALLGDEPSGTSEGFGLTKVWAIELSLTEKEYKAMQPALPGPPGAAPVAPVPLDRAVERNAFGTSFPWVDGRMTAD